MRIQKDYEIPVITADIPVLNALDQELSPREEAQKAILRIMKAVDDEREKRAKMTEDA